MPEPDEIKYQCVGCGPMNAAGAEACTGCGHRFGWNGLELPKGSIKVVPPSTPSPPAMFEEIHFSDDEIASVERQVARPRRGNGALKLLAALLLTFLFTVVFFLAIGLAGVIFLGIVCGAGGNTGIFGVGIGLIFVMAIVIGLIRVLLNYLKDSPGPGGERKR